MVPRRALLVAPVAVACGAPGPRLVRHADGSETLETERGPLVLRPDDPTRRASESRIVVWFADFECPYCRRAARDLDRLMHEVRPFRLVFKHRPLARHPNALHAAVFAQSVWYARGSDAFFRVHDAIMRSDGPADKTRLQALTAEFGFGDLSPFEPVAQTKVEEHLAQAAALGVRSTPFFFVGRTAVEGLYPYDDFRQIVS